MEVPFLIPDGTRRPADILVQTCARIANGVLERPTAFDVTIRSPYIANAKISAVTKQAGGAETAEKAKQSELKRHLREALRLNKADPIPPLEWKFVPLAFDTYAAPSAPATKVMEEHARKITYGTASSYSNTK